MRVQPWQIQNKDPALVNKKLRKQENKDHKENKGPALVNKESQKIRK